MTGRKTSGWILDRITLIKPLIYEKLSYKVFKGTDTITREQFENKLYFIEGSHLYINTLKNGNYTVYDTVV